MLRATREASLRVLFEAAQNPGVGSYNSTGYFPPSGEVDSFILKLNQTCGKCVVRHSFDAGYVGLRTVNRALRAHSDSALCKEADASLRSGLIVPQFFGDSCQSSRSVLRLFRK